ncbi:MAG: hypothetical protein ACT4P4_03745 [Betaproteobacteria bacterium]
MPKALISIALFCCTTAAIAAPRIESVSVKPNPVPFKGEQTPEVVISVTIERPTPLDLTCEALVDPGDGSKAKHMNWEIGDRRTRTTRHEYKKPGTYKLVVTGAGKDACGGKREVSVTVGGSAGAAKAEAAAPAQCPRGWTMAKGASADRFTCERR